MRTDHTCLADLIASVNAAEIESGRAPAARAWWPMICRVTLCVATAYLVITAIALIVDFSGILGQ